MNGTPTTPTLLSRYCNGEKLTPHAPLHPNETFCLAPAATKDVRESYIARIKKWEATKNLFDTDLFEQFAQVDSRILGNEIWLPVLRLPSHELAGFVKISPSCESGYSWYQKGAKKTAPESLFINLRKFIQQDDTPGIIYLGGNFVDAARSNAHIWMPFRTTSDTTKNSELINLAKSKNIRILPLSSQAGLDLDLGDIAGGAL